jgi:5'(3')-deoxyribonucleotidase
MHIGIDMDSVVTDTLSAVQKINPKWSGETWDGGCTPAEYAATWEAAGRVRNFWAHLEPLPEFDAEAVRLLQETNIKHDVFFVTNRFDTVGQSPMKQTKAWLYNMAFIMMPSVMLAKDKGPMASVLELDAFIDDRPKNCLDVLNARPNARVYLCDSSHNKTFNDPRIPRVKDLKEFLKLVLEAN